MKRINSFSVNSLLLIFAIFSGIYSCEAKTKNSSSGILLVASTPGEEQIKSLLSIAPETKVDFIRWNLFLSNAKAGKQTFTLNINFGEAQPNTLGFKNGGERRSIEGDYTISKENRTVNGEIYHLKSTKLSNEILMVKLGDNIFHLLTDQKQLMVGTGGWSYTLNRKEPLTDVTTGFTLTTLTGLPNDTSKQIIFDGRTPCSEIAKENNLSIVPGCFKLKWKLILNKDPKTLQPTTYMLKRSDHRQSDITGKWAIKKGVTSNPNVIIYELDPDKPERSISLLLGNENVAFILHKNNEFFTGNENFSYTLNRQKP